MPDVRQCAQEVISAHVLAEDSVLRDALIREYAAEHGVELLRCVFDFVHTHAIASVEEGVASNSFSFVLQGLGSVIEAVADEIDADSFEVTLNLATAEYDEGTASPELCAAARAAQTCLIIHMLVRNGEEPWGVQRNLDLQDMCLVVRVLGDLMWTLVSEAAESVGDVFAIDQLLTGVHSILGAIARAHGMTLPELLSDYWGQLALSDDANGDD